MIYSKLNETTGRIIIPQPDEVVEYNVADIRNKIAEHDREILFHQNSISKLQEMLAEFEKIGIDIK